MHEEFSPITYTWGIPLYVAFLDILGFQSALEHINSSNGPFEPEFSSGDMTFALWKNCLPQRETLSHSPKILNFVQMSDSLVIYGKDASSLLSSVCDVYGRAFVWGVPIRGGLGYGVLNHSEEFTRPGTSLSFYGQGLSDAYRAEQGGKGKGMRLFLSAEFIKNSNIEAQHQSKTSDGILNYSWWKECGIEKELFDSKVTDWWSRKTVNKWFKGSHREDTEKLFKLALNEI